MRLMERVMIVGAGGSGKSTLARRLGQITGLPVVHLDELAFRPGWEPVPKAEWRAVQADLVAGDRWIIDGNRESTMPIRLQAADTVVFLDYPRLVSVTRALKRSVRNRGQDVQAPGCPERFDPAFIRWVWRYNSKHRPRTVEMIEQFAGGADVVRLRRPGDAEEFVATVAKRHTGPR